MNRAQGVCLLAGTMILVSVGLAKFYSPWWLLWTAFIGVNLAQSAITGFCPAERVLGWLGLPEGSPMAGR